MSDRITIVLSDPEIQLLVEEELHTLAPDEQPPASLELHDGESVWPIGQPPVTLALEAQETALEVSEPEQTLLVAEPETILLEVAGGPPGPPGEDSDVVTSRTRTRTETLEDTPSPDWTTLYKGLADPGTGDENAPVWSIQRFVIDPDQNVTESPFANGTAARTQVWANRASYPYS